jgi:NADH-quinone oxidoreductase subunit M
MRKDIAVLDARLAKAAPAGDAQLSTGKPHAYPANAIHHEAAAPATAGQGEAH